MLPKQHFANMIDQTCPTAISTWFLGTFCNTNQVTSLLDIVMRIATWNLRYNAGADVWPRLWGALNLDILCLQESARPDEQASQLWELVPGNKWGSAVVLSSGTLDPIEIPNYRGWVVGGEVHESKFQSEGRRMLVFSLHSPTSSAISKRFSYIQEVNSVVSILEKILPAECDLILGGDFNFTIGERQTGEFQSTQPSEREVIRKIEQLGSSSCWSASHPNRPLEQTLRWTSDQTPHRSTPFHCDGMFVPSRWKQRTTCEVFTSECYRVSDHNPVVAWIAD